MSDTTPAPQSQDPVAEPNQQATAPAAGAAPVRRPRRTAPKPDAVGEQAAASVAASAATPQTAPFVPPAPHPATLIESAPPATAATAQLPSGATEAPAAGTAVPKQKSKFPVVPLVAGLAAGAVFGGGAGAGVAAVIVSNTHTASTVQTVQGPQTVTVSNPSTATDVTAVVAKAGPSIVTVSAAGQSESGTGSGIILTSDGYVLTNNHVVTVDGSTATAKLQVTDSSGRLYSASIVGTDPVDDLAVIKLDDASGLTPMEFGDSSKVNVGDQAIVIGSPLGLSNSVSDGIVSALNRGILVQSSAVGNGGSGDSTSPQDDGQDAPFNFWNFTSPNGSQGDGNGQDNGNQGNGNQGNGGQGGVPGYISVDQSGDIALPVIQTDAAINPGNSGGGLVNSQGQLIGVIVALAGTGSQSSSAQSGSIGVGFAIPANLADRVAQDIIKNGSATHGLLGVSVSDATSSDGGTLGAAVRSVTSGGAADQAGIKVGDVITALNGIPITGGTDLTAQVRALAAGTTASVSYVRDGSTTTVQVTVGDLSKLSS